MENKLNIKNKFVIITTLFIILIAAISSFIYWEYSSARVYIEDAKIYAPTISLYPKVGGSLQEVYINAGDFVKMNDPIARVGNELIKAKADGLILTIETSIGSAYGPTSTVATMINPSNLRVVGETEEDKGLKYIKIGQEAYFTVDAFGSPKYYGIVDEISETSNEGDIVFSISDEREEKSFNIKIRFNVDQYSELKNGMSAKLWVIK